MEQVPGGSAVVPAALKPSASTAPVPARTVTRTLLLTPRKRISCAPSGSRSHTWTPPRGSNSPGPPGDAAARRDDRGDRVATGDGRNARGGGSVARRRGGSGGGGRGPGTAARTGGARRRARIGPGGAAAPKGSARAVSSS